MTQSLRLIIQSIKLVWASSPKWTWINALLIIFRGSLPLVILWLVKLLIDEVTIVVQLPSQERVLTNTLWIVGWSGVAFLANAVSSSLSSLAREKQSYFLSDYIQNLIHNKTTKIQYSFYENIDYQDVYYRAINDANYRPAHIFYGLVGMFQNLLTIVLMGGVLASLSWWIALLLILVLIPIAYHRMKFSKRLFLVRRQQTEEERRVAYYDRLLTGKDYAKELRVFHLGHLFKKRYNQLRDQLRLRQFKWLMSKILGELVWQGATAVIVVFCYGFIAVETIQGAISSGEMVLYFLVLQRGYGYFQELMGRISSLYEDSLFLRNLFEFLMIEGIDDIAERPSEFPKPIVKGIEFKEVSFKYPHNKTWILKDINIKISPGETIALVGANGAGKSTFIKLLTGLYEPQQGEILIDGTNLNTISRKSLSHEVSAIFQDFMLYNVSAGENVWFGNVNELRDEARIIESSEQAGVHNLFAKFENGYETTLGNLFQGSEQLSQGEWQRVALARSFYNNAQLIILDEPTSSLDAFTEAKLIDHFKEIVKDRTAIIVSHRLSTISLADKIAVLDNNCLVEFGSHHELEQLQGVYYQMIQALKGRGIN